jgi:hypothetical protein
MEKNFDQRVAARLKKACSTTAGSGLRIVFDAWFHFIVFNKTAPRHRGSLHCPNRQFMPCRGRLLTYPHQGINQPKLAM